MSGGTPAYFRWRVIGIGSERPEQVRAPANRDPIRR